MSLPTLAPPKTAELKQEHLSFLEVAAQSIANIAPSATPALIIPLVFVSAGSGTWLAYVIATASLLLVTLQINQFARRSASPGSLYTYVGQGMGPFCGVICGWSLVIAYVFTAAATLAGFANYGTVLGHLVLSPSRDFLLAFVLLASAALGVWWLAYRDIKLSTRTMLILEFSSVLIILLLSLLYFVHGKKAVDATQFTLANISASGLRRALVLAIFSYVGFESATALGHEARDPLRSIPRAVLFTLVLVGGFFIFMSYTLVFAFSGQNVGLGTSNAPLSVLAGLAGAPAFGIAIAAGAAISFFACSLASINAAARVLFCMARQGLLHKAAGSAHAVHGSPHTAATLTGAVSLLIPLCMATQRMALMDIFGYLGSIATFGFLFSYVLISIAAPLALRRWRQPAAASFPIAAAALLLLSVPLVGSVYPVPPAPDRYLPVVFAILLLGGVSWFVYLRRRRPEVIADMAKDFA